jgi:hypothetical protein
MNFGRPSIDSSFASLANQARNRGSASNFADTKRGTGLDIFIVACSEIRNFLKTLLGIWRKSINQNY